MIPTTPHKLTKISEENRRLLLRLALCVASLSATSLTIGTLTNNWMYTAERLKYYTPPNVIPNDSIPEYLQPKYFKNATLGPWLFCWTDPAHEYACTAVNHFSSEEPSDTTTSVEQSIRKTTIFLLLGMVFDGIAFLFVVLINIRERSYKTVLTSSLMHIFAGMLIFLSLIVYMASIAQEVGKKMYAATHLDDPLFSYTYGYSFLSIMISFLCTEMTAIFTLMVFMAKRDERLFNMYKIRGLFRGQVFRTLSSSPGVISRSRSSGSSGIGSRGRFHRSGSLSLRRASPMLDQSDKSPTASVLEKDRDSFILPGVTMELPLRFPSPAPSSTAARDDYMETSFNEDFEWLMPTGDICHCTGNRVKYSNVSVF